MTTNMLTLQDIIADIHALNEDLAMYERKYGVLSQTFYDSWQRGEEPDDDAWVLDWQIGRALQDLAPPTRTIRADDRGFASTIRNAGRRHREDYET